MKCAFNYKSASKNRTVAVTIETCSYGNDTVYLVYRDGEFEHMSDKLINLFWFIRNQYGQERVDQIKVHFQ
jgi:hypothetical protein